jgi:CheY-like chemotaxis protein
MARGIDPASSNIFRPFAARCNETRPLAVEAILTQHRARRSFAGFASPSRSSRLVAHVRIDRQLGTISDRRRSHCLRQLAPSLATGNCMARPSLEGRSILVVEDQPLIALDITQELEAAGAGVTTTNTLKHALILVEHDGLCGAILDHALGDGDSSLLCSRLKSRGIPFMIYSGFNTVSGACAGALHIAKPAANGALVAAMEGLSRPTTSQTKKSARYLMRSGGSVTNIAWLKRPYKNYTTCSQPRMLIQSTAAKWK